MMRRAFKHISRRSLSTGASGAAQSHSSNVRTPVLVVGGGRMGHIRAAAFMGSRRATLAGIVESDPRRALEMGETYHCPVYSSVDKALAECPRIGGVWVATPTPTHKETVSVAIRAGLPVGVEKPVAETQADIRDLYSLAKEHGVHLYCSFQRRVDPSYQRLYHAVREGRVGTIRSIHAVFRDHPVPPMEFLKQGGDIFHDLVVHDADFVMHLLQERPTKVYATGRSFYPELQEAGVMDQALVVLEFASGVVATIELSRCSPYGYDQRFEVFGSDGMLQVRNLASTTLVSSSKAGIQHDNPVHSFPQRFAEAYVLEVEQFLRTTQGHPPSVTAEDSVNSSLVADLCKEAVKQQRPVDFPQQ